MTAPPDSAAEHFLVSYGKSGGLGSFTAAEPMPLDRGDRVVVDTPRGREVGTVLGPANIRQARLLGAVATGTIVRPIEAGDELALRESQAVSLRLFDVSRELARARGLLLEILDVDVFLEGRAVVQFIGDDNPDLAAFARELGDDFQLEILLENLALPSEPTHGCGKPDCGRTEGGGGCSTCGSEGGCSTCGTGSADLRPYFAHLREQMETGQRTSLL